MKLKHNTQMKIRSPQTAQFVSSLHEDNKPVFHLADVQRILAMKRDNARNFVRKLVDRAVAIRLKPGLYILIPSELGRERAYMGNPLIVAREINNGAEYYLSHGTAMEIHGMVAQPRLVFHVTILTNRRPINIMGAEFRFHASHKELFFGLMDHWVTKQERVRISDPERTIIDGLRMPEYCGGVTELAKGIWMKKEELDSGRLVDYALRTDIGAVIRRLGYLMELFQIGSPKKRDPLRERLTDTVVRLEPLLPAGGKFLHRWRLQLNVTPDEMLAVART
jgi:predicted transcriptional regulator of viral defense system